MRQTIAGMSVLAVLAGLTISSPARAADELRTVSRDGLVLMHHRVAKPTTR